jgi:hypothetical protein
MTLYRIRHKRGTKTWTVWLASVRMYGSTIEYDKAGSFKSLRAARAYADKQGWVKE